MKANRNRDVGLGTLTFWGGAGTVTGSKTLLTTTGGRRLLVDCGLFQGLKELRLRNWEDLPLPAVDLEAVLLTHAHLDHCGYLPRLVAQGVRGPVYCTEGTRRLAEIVLLDSGRLQEEQAEHANRHGYSKHTPALPLYSEEDAKACLPLLSTVDFDQRVEVLPGVTAVWRRAGHILGAATIKLRLEGHDHSAGYDVVFSGDLGRSTHPLLLPPEPIGHADLVVTESTYGDETHPPDDAEAAMADAIGAIAESDGVLVIPAFSVDRTEVVLWHLDRLVRDGRVPRLPVFLDSPMALRALDVYEEHAQRGPPRSARPTAASHCSPRSIWSR
ncbi:MAG: MBL fold metallo-hydrolase [Nocardioides sp.]